MILTLFVLSLSSSATVAAEGSDRIIERTIPWPEKKDGFCFSFEDIQPLLKTASDYPLALREITNLTQTNANLSEQLKGKDELLAIAEERRKLYEEKAVFYEKMVESQKVLSSEYAKLNEKLEAKIEREKTWSIIKAVVAVGVGVAIGLLF